jgi:hypothetical protein
MAVLGIGTAQALGFYYIFLLEEKKEFKKNIYLGV